MLADSTVHMTAVQLNFDMARRGDVEKLEDESCSASVTRNSDRTAATPRDH